MLKPIVAARDRSEIIEDLASLIPERGAWPRIERGATHALLFLKAEIKRTAEFALEEIRQKLGDVSQIPMENRQDAKRKLYYDLTISPEYQQYREQLKYAIIRIVREKYLRTTKFSSDREREEFLTNLSIYLHEVLHETITEYFYVPTDTNDVKNGESKSSLKVQKSSLTVNEEDNGITSQQILNFANEAKVLGKKEVAERWYQELCARDGNNSDNWFSYAVFCLSLGDIDKAQECLCEAISINPNHHNSLICAPFVLAMTQHSFNEDSSSSNKNYIEESRLFLERAQCSDKNPGLTWTLTVIFHEYCLDSGCTKNASILMDQALSKVKTIESKQTIVDEFSIPKSCFLDAARFLIESHLLSFAEKALAHELQSKGTAVQLQAADNVELIDSDHVFIESHTNPKRIAEYNTLLGELHMFRGEDIGLELARDVFEQATTLFHRYTEAWAMLGHVFYSERLNAF